MLFKTALTATILLVIASFFIDSNGDLPGMNRVGSATVTVTLYIVSFASSLSLLIVDKTRRLQALLLLAIAVAFALPAFF